jgi:effector-associated domain 5 (EAD5)-containing protein
MAVLSHNKLIDLHAAIESAGLTKQRSALLAGLDRFASLLAENATPSAQIFTDLSELNRTEVLADGTVPLLRWLQNAVALAGVRREKAVFERARDGVEIRALLLRLYPEADQLVELRGELGWSVEEHGRAEDRGALVDRLVDHAVLVGVEGMGRLLGAVAHDHPASAEIGLLRERALGGTRAGTMRDMPSRAQRARKILQLLQPAAAVGVAILEPLGFNARAVVDEVLAQLGRPGESLLPVRFVPQRSTHDEAQLYGRLLKDLRYALPEPWRKVVDARTDGSAIDRFEYAVEDLLVGPVQETGRKLLFVIEGLARVPAMQLEHWGFLLARLSGRGLKLLVWGGQELHELRRQPQSGGRSSAFHVLREEQIGTFSSEEVQRLVVSLGGAPVSAAVVYEETGGHPALVEELLERYPEDALAGDREAIAARIRNGVHLDQLRRIVEGELALQEMLRGFVEMDGRPLVRGRKRGEVRLEWLGILKDGGAKSWDWVAPAMQRFAGEWL